MLSQTSSEILYVPFNSDYTVNHIIKTELDEKEFFEECFVKPFLKIPKGDEIGQETDFDVRDDSDDSDKNNETDTEKSIETSYINNYRRAHKFFMRWIKDSGRAVYCVMGEAGSGKTTYLRYLEYYYRNRNVKWKIIDIQNSMKEVIILDKEYVIPHHDRLIYKAISCILVEICKCIFDKSSDVRHYMPAMKVHLEKIYTSYKTNIKEDMPRESIKVFFNDSPVYNKSANDMDDKDLDSFSQRIVDYLDRLFKKGESGLSEEDEYSALRRLWRVYCTLLVAEESDTKYVIAFDNIERFIGADEICNSQINNFVEKLRLLNDNDTKLQDNLYMDRIQTVVFMRNASERMSNLPLHRIDFGGHEIDITGWFPVQEVFRKKITWYEKHSIEVSRVKRMNMVLGDVGFPPRAYSSLHSKLNMLFNYNKRVIIQLLDRALNPDVEDTDTIISERPTNIWSKSKILERFDVLMEEACQKNSIYRYAARSIIIRLLLDVLREDEFFKNIHVTDHEINGDEAKKKVRRLGYSREVLLVLYNYQLNGNTDYMPYDTLMTQLLRHRQNGTLEKLFDENQKSERIIISEILYYMNYYNTRQKDWLHLVDVQYNISDSDEGFHVADCEQMDELIVNAHDKIGVKITQAGIAYLHYIVHSFEYFSCRVRDYETPPLMSLVPTIEQLNSKEPIDELLCVKTINSVQRDAARCIIRMRKRPSSNEIRYTHIRTHKSMTHEERIYGAHRAHIEAFYQLFKESVKKDDLTSIGKKHYRQLGQYLVNAAKHYKNKLTEIIAAEERNQMK